jgi:hypothetical protein
MKTLIKTLGAERGELFAVRNGQRVLLAEVKPLIRVYEHETSVPILGETRYTVKTRSFSLIICPGENTTQRVDLDFLREVRCFDLAADISRQNGEFERVLFNNLTPLEINLPGDWIFSNEEPALIAKLLSM